MNAFCGTVGEDTALGVAGEPMNAGTAATSDGFWGIGEGATPWAPAPRARTTGRATLSTATIPMRRSPQPVIRRSTCALERIATRDQLPLYAAFMHDVSALRVYLAPASIARATPRASEGANRTSHHIPHASAVTGITARLRCTACMIRCATRSGP